MIIERLAIIIPTCGTVHGEQQMKKVTTYYCYYSQLAAYIESKRSLGTSLRQLIQTSDVLACCPDLPLTVVSAILIGQVSRSCASLVWRC